MSHERLTAADIASRLGISASAVSRAAREHDIGEKINPRLRLYRPGDVRLIKRVVPKASRTK